MWHGGLSWGWVRGFQSRCCLLSLLDAWPLLLYLQLLVPVSLPPGSLSWFLPGNLPGQMVIPFPILLDLARPLGGQCLPSIPWGVGGGHQKSGVHQITQFSLSRPLCSSVSGSQALSHHSVGIKWAARLKAVRRASAWNRLGNFIFSIGAWLGAWAAQTAVGLTCY